MPDQVVHAFDKDHAAFALERQRMYTTHQGCPPAVYDWAQGTVCGCGTPLLGPNPPIGDKGERMKTEVDGEEISADRFVEKFIHELDAGGNCRVPWCPSTSDNGRDHVRYNISWVGPPNHDHLLKPGFAPFPPDTDAEHELAAGVFVEESFDESKQLVFALPLRELPDTKACNYIFGDGFQSSKLVDWCMQFIKKQMDYGDSANDLGKEGQYAEIHRKLGKLRRAMWEGQPLHNEGLDEVLMDLVGHCFLAMMFNSQPQLVRYPKGDKK